MVPVAWREPDPLVAPAEHGAADLGIAVLEGEIPVAGGGADEVADFALYPDEVEVALQQVFCLAIELADGQGDRLGVIVKRV